jgi:23S rRNA pseudouridine1911/1915/1917 synthase
MADWNVLFEDHHLIVANKPAPLLTQSPQGVPSLEMFVKSYIKEKYQKPAGVYLGIPHRLDRPVSGVIVFARNTKAAQRVHEQFQKRTVEKVYWAVVSGVVSEQEGVWENWIRKLPDEAKVEQAKANEPDAKYAKLAFRVLKINHELNQSLIELHPETGRSHQLRVQSAWRGYPILGDSQYGSTATLPNQVIGLHARQLSIDHPFTKERLTWTAPLPQYWPEWSQSETAS